MLFFPFGIELNKRPLFNKSIAGSSKSFIMPVSIPLLFIQTGGENVPASNNFIFLAKKKGKFSKFPSRVNLITWSINYVKIIRNKKFIIIIFNVHFGKLFAFFQFICFKYLFYPFFYFIFYFFFFFTFEAMDRDGRK